MSKESASSRFHALERADVIVDELVSALTMFRAVQTRTSALLIADCSSSGGLG